MYKATALAKPVSRMGEVRSRLDGDERAQRRTAKLARIINETVGEYKIARAPLTTRSVCLTFPSPEAGERGPRPLEQL